MVDHLFLRTSKFNYILFYYEGLLVARIKKPLLYVDYFDLGLNVLILNSLGLKDWTPEVSDL